MIIPERSSCAKIFAAATEDPVSQLNDVIKFSIRVGIRVATILTAFFQMARGDRRSERAGKRVY